MLLKVYCGGKGAPLWYMSCQGLNVGLHAYKFRVLHTPPLPDYYGCNFKSLPTSKKSSVFSRDQSKSQLCLKVVLGIEPGPYSLRHESILHNGYTPKDYTDFKHKVSATDVISLSSHETWSL